jgi:hypothetical protein
MNATATITNFVKQVKAQLTGDQTEVVALKNARKADSAVNGQLAALKSRLVDLEGTVEDREESLHLVKFPKDLITDNQSFIRRINESQEMLDDAYDALVDVKSSIDYFEALAAEYSQEG